MWEGNAADARRRNWILSSIVLKTTRVGDIHRSVTLLTEAGLVRAMAHGAAKATSRLRAATLPFSYVRAYLYRDPVRDSVKLTDVEPLALHHHLSGDLLKYFTASLWAEVVIKSHAGGLQQDELQRRLLNALDRLDGAGTDEVAKVSAAFLWQVLEHWGVAPDTDVCSSCERRLADTEGALLHLADVSLWCRGCHSDAAGATGVAGVMQELNAGMRRLLASIRKTSGLALMDDTTAAAAGPSPAEQRLQDWDRLRRLLQQLMQHTLERPLNALACAAGIL